MNLKSKTNRIICITLALILTATAFSGCSSSKEKKIAVFVPGIVADSPVYSMLVDGVNAAVEEYNQANGANAAADIFEAGTNQAEWNSKLTSIVSTGKYEVIISSNPSLPDLAVPLTKTFPSQKFLLLDATCEGNKSISTVCYNQYEQAYVTGYIGSLMSKSHKMALIAAQEYPVMNEIIYPFFVKGAQDAVSGTSVEFRIVGNWYDATKGAELADSVAKIGVDVILPICGGASQGVISSAVNNGIYITWFDNNGFDKAPGTIISSTVMEQAKMTKEVTLEYLNGNTKWGTARMSGMKEGFVNLVQDDERYINTVPESIRKNVAALVDDIKSGKKVIK